MMEAFIEVTTGVPQDLSQKTLETSGGGGGGGNCHCFLCYGEAPEQVPLLTWETTKFVIRNVLCIREDKLENNQLLEAYYYERCLKTCESCGVMANKAEQAFQQQVQWGRKYQTLQQEIIETVRAKERNKTGFGGQLAPTQVTNAYFLHQWQGKCFKLIIF